MKMERTRFVVVVVVVVAAAAVADDAARGRRVVVLEVRWHMMAECRHIHHGSSVEAIC
jgi:hypothetical protein